MANSEEYESILDWLNSLPEVQAVLSEHFKGAPISKQNLYDWKQHGFRNWTIRQTAFEFLADMEPGDNALEKTLTETLTDKLTQWTVLRYAATTRTLDSKADTDPETELRCLRNLCADVIALRRGDLSAGRLALEQKRLALTQTVTDQQKEKEFWEWTLRPDIQAKLYPNRDPDQLEREVVKLLDRQLLGIKPANRHEAPDPDPATLI